MDRPSFSDTRLRGIDLLRGLMLVMIAVTHLPTRFADPLSQPLGYVSSAEGFVFISAFLCGMVYTRIAADKGLAAMRTALWRRAGKVYACHAAMLAFLFTVIAAIGISTQRAAVNNLISFYLHDPATALWTGFALIYNPPLLDILPMYVVFMLASPLLLSAGLRQGWAALLACSAALWLMAQFGLANILYEELTSATGLKVPLHETGSFQLLAWQFLWIGGLWFGSERAGAAGRPVRVPRGVLVFAVVFGLAGFTWRHVAGQVPFGDGNAWNFLQDKWALGPLRLLGFAALLTLAVRYGPALAARLRVPALETCGAASLATFCTQLVITLLALAFVGDKLGNLPVTGELSLLAGTFLAMWAVGATFTRRPRPPGLRGGSARPVSAGAA